MTPPLADDLLEPALLPFGESTMLPAEAYTSPDVLAWERRQFFSASWVCLGRVEAVFPEGRTQVATTVGDIGVLLSVGGAGEVAAFANTCRHRGHELLPDGGTSVKRAVVCPYHAWSYDLSGALIAAPGFHEVASFDPAAHGLVRLPAEVWHGWVFVNALGTAAPFAAHVGGLEGLVAPYAPERLVLGATHEYVVAANWKVITENYHECYHCPLIHPELCEVSPPASGSNFDLPGVWVGGTMDLRDGADTMSLTGRSDGVPIEGVDPRVVLYLGLLPNLLLSLHPDYVMTHRMTPLAPDRTQVECAWYFASADVDPAYAVDFWDTTNRQDWGACESVQRGLASPHFRPGPLAPNEDAVHELVTTIARGYRDGVLAG
ncbi:MAG: glycine betaine catabolism [Actinomycetota bacterium]|jgi:Rieske 2Fe-2S family protein|nr:glycine betaine catabolism [Actinomycetota bacterium]